MVSFLKQILNVMDTVKNPFKKTKKVETERLQRIRLQEEQEEEANRENFCKKAREIKKINPDLWEDIAIALSIAYKKIDDFIIRKIDSGEIEDPVDMLRFKYVSEKDFLDEGGNVGYKKYFETLDNIGNSSIGYYMGLDKFDEFLWENSGRRLHDYETIEKIKENRRLYGKDYDKDLLYNADGEYDDYEDDPGYYDDQPDDEEYNKNSESVKDDYIDEYEENEGDYDYTEPENDANDDNEIFEDKGKSKNIKGIDINAIEDIYDELRF